MRLNGACFVLIDFDFAIELYGDVNWLFNGQSSWLVCGVVVYKIEEGSCICYV